MEMAGRKACRDGVENEIYIPYMQGNVGSVLSGLSTGSKRNLRIIEKGIRLLMGLSLKGYEGKSVGTVLLIGDLENLRRNTSQLVANPFKGYFRKYNITDPQHRRTFEAYSRLDGAMMIDHKGFISSAGRVIDIKEDRQSGVLVSDQDVRRGRGKGTRDKAARYITSVTKTVAVTLSSDGDITVYERGKSLGKLEWRVLRLCSEEQFRQFLDFMESERSEKE